jgi:hypothetical protein
MQVTAVKKIIEKLGHESALKKIENKRKKRQPSRWHAVIGGKLSSIVLTWVECGGAMICLILNIYIVNFIVGHQSKTLGKSYTYITIHYPLRFRPHDPPSAPLTPPTAPRVPSYDTHERGHDDCTPLRRARPRSTCRRLHQLSMCGLRQTSPGYLLISFVFW